MLLPVKALGSVRALQVLKRWCACLKRWSLIRTWSVSRGSTVMLDSPEIIPEPGYPQHTAIHYTTPPDCRAEQSRAVRWYSCRPGCSTAWRKSRSGSATLLGSPFYPLRLSVHLVIDTRRSCHFCNYVSIHIILPDPCLLLAGSHIRENPNTFTHPECRLLAR